MKKSWRTTTVGVAGGIGILATQVVALFDTDPNTVFSVEAVVAALAMMGIGYLSRDRKVSSEEENAK